MDIRSGPDFLYQALGIFPLHAGRPAAAAIAALAGDARKRALGEQAGRGGTSVQFQDKLHACRIGPDRRRSQALGKQRGKPPGKGRIVQIIEAPGPVGLEPDRKADPGLRIEAKGGGGDRALYQGAQVVVQRER